MSYEADRTLFEREGYVIVRQLLPAAEFEELRGNIDRYIREVVPGVPDRSAFYHDRARPETLKQLQYMGEHDAFFAGYVRHPAWVGLAEAMLGEPAAASGVEWFNKPPGTRHATPPHQDNYYFNLDPPNAATLWMALDRVDRENGCLRYVPGSHRLGIRPHAASHVLGFSQHITDYGPDDRAREVEIHLDPGDVVVHHCQMIHRAEANLSPTRQRRAVALVFYGASARRNEQAYQRYKDAAREQHLAQGLKV
jgi:phytanoyl-CoA hydroxylase